MKVAPLSFASAFANIVFPHPGCPYNSTPLGALSNPFALANSSGYVSGYITVSLRLAMISSNPPILSNVTSMLLGGMISAAIVCSYSSRSSSTSCCSLSPALVRMERDLEAAFLEEAEEEDEGSNEERT